MGQMIVHANSVALNGRAVLIVGASGRGKSSLSLQMMALGAALIADDSTVLQVKNGLLMASCPPRMSGLIEARGVGILTATTSMPAPVAFIVDMDTDERDRLPPRRTRVLHGLTLPLIYRGDAATFASALMLLLRGDRHA